MFDEFEKGITIFMAILAAWMLGYGAGMRHYEDDEE